MWRNRNTPPLLVGLKDGTTTLEISLAVPEDPVIPLLGIYPEASFFHCVVILWSQTLSLNPIALFPLALST